MLTTSLTVGDVASRLRLAVVRTARRMRQEALAGAGGVELSPTNAAALATIELHGPLTPSELAERERVQRPTATRVIARLEDAGLVLRTPDPADGRACLVSVTPEGQVLVRRIRRRKDEYLARRLRRLDGDDVATLERAASLLENLLEERDGA
jgi:DNA-binding MarR family transcriptional regulator